MPKLKCSPGLVGRAPEPAGGQGSVGGTPSPELSCASRMRASRMPAGLGELEWTGNSVQSGKAGPIPGVACSSESHHHQHAFLTPLPASTRLTALDGSGPHRRYWGAVSPWPPQPYPRAIERQARRASRSDTICSSSDLNTRPAVSCRSRVRCSSDGMRRPTSASSMRRLHGNMLVSMSRAASESRTWAARTAPGCATSECRPVGGCRSCLGKRSPSAPPRSSSSAASRPSRRAAFGPTATSKPGSSRPAPRPRAASSTFAVVRRPCRAGERGTRSRRCAGIDVPLRVTVLASLRTRRVRDLAGRHRQGCAPRPWSPSLCRLSSDTRTCSRGRDSRSFPTMPAHPRCWSSRACSRVRAKTGKLQIACRQRDRAREPRDARALRHRGEKVARGTINVLLAGETGVGKEILAETIHRRSPRAERPFVCGQLRGAGRIRCSRASSSATRREPSPGRPQAKAGPAARRASGGTLFLDEIGEMSLGLQAKLLRAIESSQVMRVGATKPQRRRRSLRRRHQPRSRRGDGRQALSRGSLLPSERHHLDHSAAARSRPTRSRLLARAVPRARCRPARPAAPRPSRRRRWLCSPAYAWPGNIRELRNVIERAFLLSSGRQISREHLPVARMSKSSLSPEASGAPVASVEPDKVRDYDPPAGAHNFRDLERLAILDALARCAGNQTRAAELLRHPPPHLLRKAQGIRYSTPEGVGGLDP